MPPSRMVMVLMRVIVVVVAVFIVVMFGAVGVLIQLFSGTFRRSFEGFRCHGDLLCGRLLQIAFDEINEFVCGLRLWRVGFDFLAQHVAANMPLDNFGHQPVKGPAARRWKLQNGKALLLLLKSSMQRIHLAANSIRGFEELVFMASGMGHRSINNIPPYIIQQNQLQTATRLVCGARGFYAAAGYRSSTKAGDHAMSAI
jgi:hypothetical protein